MSDTTKNHSGNIVETVVSTDTLGSFFTKNCLIIINIKTKHGQFLSSGPLRSLESRQKRAHCSSPTYAFFLCISYQLGSHSDFEAIFEAR